VSIFPYISPNRFASVLIAAALGSGSLGGSPSSPSSQAAAPKTARRPMTDEEVITRFHQIWYDSKTTWPQNHWLGLQTLQNPMDVWITQEIISEIKPDYFVECGAWEGGSAAIWAMVLSQVNPAGKVISIDITDRMAAARKLPIVKSHVEFMLGFSTEPKIVDAIAGRVRGKKVVVLLDSDHSKGNVAKELKAYAPLVSVGSYFIVQDSNVNGHPVMPNFGEGGPWEAVTEFLASNKNFEIDKSRERLLFTFCPNGFLRRIR
jgi:cephalosporin hydroxylase